MTRWIVHPTIAAEAAPVLDWARAYLAPYDRSSLDRIRLDVGPDRTTRGWQGLYGYCKQPRWLKIQRGYRIYCQASGPFPFTLHADGTSLRDLGEAVAWIVGHEVFHFLCATRQIRGRNTEAEANAAGAAAVKHYRAFVARAKPTKARARSPAG